MLPLVRYSFCDAEHLSMRQGHCACLFAHAWQVSGFMFHDSCCRLETPEMDLSLVFNDQRIVLNEQ